MTFNLKSYSTALLAFFAGCLLPLAFAPISFAGASLISLALLSYCLFKSNLRHAFFNGWYYGIGLFLVGVSWVYVSIHNYGNTNWLGAGLLTALLIAALGLFYASFSLAYKFIFQHRHFSAQILGFAALWTISEYLRSFLFTGFPWLFLGFGQVNTPLKYLAPVIGVYGLSFIVALSASLLFWAWLKLSRKDRGAYLLIILLLLYLLPGLLKSVNWTNPSSKLLPASIVQANLSVKLKWDSDYVVDLVKTYLTMSQDLWQEGNLVIWPEGALPLVYQSALPFLKPINKVAKQHHASLLAGIFFREDERYFNGIMTLGNASGHYYKYHLVPFGEYLPFEKWLRGLINFFDIPMSDLYPGNLKQPLLIANNVKIVPFICYEIAYSDRLLRALPAAQLLVTLSDDAWFGHSFAPAQHLEIAQMRSLQTGRYQLMANNEGISAIIGPDGQILKTIPAFKAGILSGTYRTMEGLTPWARIGDNCIIILMLGLIIVLVLAEKIKLCLHNVQKKKNY